MINSTMTVREAALSLPEATRLFEELKIDYCCGGDKTLAEACAKAGLEADDVMHLLARSTISDEQRIEPSFQKVSLSELITHIFNKHHVYTRTEMSRLTQLLSKRSSLECGALSPLWYAAPRRFNKLEPPAHNAKALTRQRTPKKCRACGAGWRPPTTDHRQLTTDN
jgi:regulator of cell morphogenesis and NO signaling